MSSMSSMSSAGSRQDGGKPIQRELLPLTQGQLGIWLMQMLDPHDPSWNIGECVEIRGQLDERLFERALRLVLAATDAMHIRLVETDAGPAQYFEHDPEWEFVQKDFGPGADPEQAARHWMDRDMGRPFRLDSGKLYRYALLRVGADRYFWYAANHHIINDGVGWRLIQRRVSEVYSALANGVPITPLPAASWRDIVTDELGYRRSDEFERDRRYWLEQVAERPPPVTLSGRPPAPPDGHIKATGRIPHSLDLENGARRHSTSPAALIVAATAIYLHRMTGASDMLIGMPLAGRVGAKSRSIVGMSANALPLRIAVAASEKIGDVIARTARGMRAALRHQRYRGEDLRRDLNTSPSTSDIYGTYVNFTPFEQGIAFAGHPASSDPLGNWRVEDLQLVYYGGNHREGQRLDVVGNPKHYTTTDLAEHARRFIGVVEQLTTADADAPVAQIEVLTAVERQSVLHDWNDTAQPIPAVTVADLFEAQVRQRADAPALVFHDRTLSYGELDIQANRVAHALAARGIGPGKRVALMIPRGVEMVSALVGILKVGAAYVPLDPDYPAARIAYMLADCRPALVLASKAGAHLLPDGLAALIIDTDGVRDELSRHPGTGTPPGRQRLGPDDPAYVIYTSGSTGRPKGVVGSHRAMVNRLAWMASTFAFEGTGPTLAKTSLAFIDGSTELLGPLTSGASIVLADPAAARDPAALATLIKSHAIGRMTVVPSLLSAILDTADPAQLSSCKLWITSGAAIPKRLCERFHAELPDARLVNLYGTSEVCGDSLYALCSPQDCPIGRPIWNTRAYILNDRLEPVPVGVKGELYLAGTGLADGYFGRDDLTAERFVANPLSAAGGLMYRTGDLACWRADGTIEFLGRSDNQVKINGIRIELSEIESALQSCPAVGDAAVVVRKQEESAGQIVAFVTAASSAETPDEGKLRAHLASLLPDPVIPTVFSVIDQLPPLPNGKLDRRALVERAGAIATAGRTSVAPLRTPTEIAVAEIWTEVLRQPVLDRRADFFALGGDSLRAIQVMTRVRRLYSIELPLNIAFEARTLEAVAERIDRAVGDDKHKSLLPALSVAPAATTAPLSFSQQRMWTIQSLDPSNTAYNMSAALRLIGAIDYHAMEQAIDALSMRHPILRTTYHIVEGNVVQRVEPFEAGTLAIADLRADESDPEQAAFAIATSMARTPIDLERGPVFASKLMRTGTDEHILSFVIHHIAGDQWSTGVLGRELASVYNALRAGRAVEARDASPSYRDFAIWEREHLGGPEIEGQLGYWRGKLASVAPLDLPTDKPRPRVPSLKGELVSTKVPEDLFAGLERFARREGATLFMTMLAGFVALLSRLCDQRDIAVGVPVANRSNDAVEQMVGTFVNLLVLRIDLSGDPGLSEIVARVKTTALEAFDNQNVPFERLVQDLVQSRDTNRAPLAQVMFNAFNTPMHGLDIDGLSWESITPDRGGAQFEISVTADRQITQTMLVEYNSDLFERSTVDRFMARYQTVLWQAVAAPLTRLSELDLLGDDERRLVLETWNATAVGRSHTPFIATFEARAVAQPDAPAVTFGNVTLSYGELDARANALAHALSRAGIGRGAKVGVCLERSLAMVIALLAVQKTGGAYVPLDPEFPAARLAYMMSDSGLGVIITSTRTSSTVEVPAHVVRIDAEAFAGAGAPVAAAGPARDIRPSDPVYVIYTSGSTGRPKGVVIPHEALANFVTSMQREPGLRETDVLAAVTTISFDIAGLELYLPLTVGARIELVAPTTASDGVALSRLIAERNVTVMQATPATWRMLIDAGWGGSPRLRALCGGEALPRELAEPLLDRVGELWNLYGPTETTIWSTAGRVKRGDTAISIGRPIDNTQIYILNGLTPVPVGGIGEICIGGTGVAIGYLGRDDLTAERFVADPFARRPGARMYRTGDLGRWGADGRLHHLGRTDHQVKVRGFRIEVGEIEAVLNEHSSVRQAVVVAREIGPGDVRLVAYVHYRDGEELTISEVRRYLRTRLPDYMIPAITVPIDAVPLSTSGKVDRNALPNPFEHAVRPATAFEPPGTGLETVVAGIWRQLLKVEKVGADDNFFELGGDSLLAVRFVAVMEKECGIRVEPRNLFFQNLRQVAAAYGEVSRAGEGRLR